MFIAMGQKFPKGGSETSKEPPRQYRRAPKLNHICHMKITGVVHEALVYLFDYEKYLAKAAWYFTKHIVSCCIITSDAISLLEKGKIYHKILPFDFDICPTVQF